MTTSRITTHVLDSSTGVPAQGMHVELAGREGNGWRQLDAGITDVDGRIMRLGGDDLPAGEYRVNRLVAIEKELGEDADYGAKYLSWGQRG